MVGKGEPNGGNAESTPFHSRTHRAGIEHIDGGVRTVVNATDNQSRRFGKKGMHCQFHTVYRGAIHFIHLRPMIVGKTGGAKGPVYRYGHRLTGTGSIRTYTHNLSERKESIYEGMDSVSLDAIIVGDKYKHSFLFINVGKGAILK